MESFLCSQGLYEGRIENLRNQEYPELLKTTYLDHAGTTLYASSLIDAYSQDLKSNLYGNPHSDSPASDLSTQRVENARLSVLKYLNADPKYFDVVFTANSTAAIKLVADCFRDQEFWYGFHKDAHSSIVGVREVAKSGSRCFTSNQDVESWIESRGLPSSSSGVNLFAYPAQSNMTGYRLPLSWSAKIRNSSPLNVAGKQNTYVLLDAASYLTTGRLNLEDHEAAPDFIVLSFYKIFGFPDLGALIVRKSAHDVLTSRRYFGGGTVDQVTVIGATFHEKKSETIHDFLEDGTLPFHNIVALSHAISVHEKLYLSAQAISNHTSQLSAWLYQHLSSLRHSNHRSVVQIYKDPNGIYGKPETQGPIFAFSVLRSNGTFIGKSHFERLAIDCGFQLRTGGVCNPGGIASMLDLSHWELRRNLVEGARCGGDIDVLGGKPTGIIRVSLGPMSTFGDIKRFVEFIEFFFVERTLSAASSNISHQHQHKSQSVAAVEFCPAIILEQTHDAAAYQVWHGQWCITKQTPTGWKPLVSNIRLQSLICRPEPEQGILRISQAHRSDLKVSLWERPKEDANPVPTSSTEIFDVYPDKYIEQWLTEAIGFPCTLARYRGQAASTLPQARTCQIPTCASEFASRTELHEDYKTHAMQFMKSHPFTSKEPLPPTTKGHNPKFSGSTAVYSINEAASTQSTDLDLVKNHKVGKGSFWGRFFRKVLRSCDGKSV